MLPRMGIMHCSTSSPMITVTNGAMSNWVRSLLLPAAAKPFCIGSSKTWYCSGSIQTGKKPSATSAAAATPAGVMVAA